MDTSGFYKLDNETTLLYAPNFVAAPEYSLDKTIKNDFTYPVNGWYWFDSEEEAKQFFNLE